jgi:group I intron endonuclease
MGIIYKIVNKINGKIYIGQTKQQLKNRFNHHCYSSKYKYHNSPIYQSFRKYGINNFDIFEIEKCDNSLLNKKEEFYINEYNSLTPNGYNILKGCISQGLSENWLNSETFKKGRIRQADKLRGVPLSKEHKKNISLSRINNPIVIEANKKNSMKFVQKYKGIKPIALTNGLKRLKEITGKTYEEIYGIEKAKEISDKLKNTWTYKDKIKQKEIGEKNWKHKRKTYKIIYPNEKEEIILGLNKFCIINNLQTTKMAKIARNEKWFKSHKGFKCEEIII